MSLNELCIINYADGIFLKGQQRLRESLIESGFPGKILFFDTLLPGWPKHENVPWGFKPYAFEEARKQGHTLVLWIDAAGIVIRSLQPILRIIEKEGVFVFSRYSNSVGEWSSDYALDILRISREETFKMPEISGFCIGINFNHEKGRAFFNEWKKRAEEGKTFLGVVKPLTIKDSMNNTNNILSSNSRVRGHRHDQTVASIIAYHLGLRPTRRYIFDLIGEARGGKKYADYIPLDTIIVHNRDIKYESYLKNLSHYKITPKTIIRSSERYSKDLIKKFLLEKRKFR